MIRILLKRFLQISRIFFHKERFKSMRTFYRTSICVLFLSQFYNQLFAQSLVIKNKERHNLKLADSSAVLNLDTLMLGKKSSLYINDKKSLTINAKNIFFGDKSAIVSHDGKNNGTNLIINGRFIDLGKAVIDVSGLDYRFGSAKFPNGNGGNVIIKYDEQGLMPTSSDTKSNNFLEILNRGASSNINPQVEISNIWYRIAIGSGIGRSPTGLPNGKIYDASVGKDGDIQIIVSK